jgi:hypothetical protein
MRWTEARNAWIRRGVNTWLTSRRIRECSGGSWSSMLWVIAVRNGSISARHSSERRS